MDLTRRLFAIFWISACCCPLLSSGQGYVVQPVPFTSVKINDVFWTPRLESHVNTTLPVCIAQMRDSTSRISNFEKAAGLKSGKFEGTFFDDSDVYKAMEGMAYSLQNRPDPEIEAIMDHWSDLIEKAQQPDGYINTFFTLERDKDYWEENGRWSDIGRHEMYCGGHLIEAGVAYYQATGKRKLLDVGIRFADHWMEIFGPGKRHWVEGHQEPELALVKLYHVTGEEKYLRFAHWLLEERGHGHEFGPMWEWNPNANGDIQSDVPVKDIRDVKGHAVRAMYMYSAMADIVANTADSTYMTALHSVWDDVVLRNMYITGAIGASHTNEGFVEDFDLPNKTSYCETCASVGMVFWNHRMNLLLGDAKYADVMERSLYNAVLAGVSLAGDRFFYVNPLESDGDRRRSRWHGTACCPSNISRFMPSVGKYVYTVRENELTVNLYTASQTEAEVGGTVFSIVQQTQYPWDGEIKIRISPETPSNASIRFRIPGWCRSYTAELNGVPIEKGLDRGYLVLSRQWQKGDEITLDLRMPVEAVAADPRVKANIGKRALQRGPLVYALEQVDNPGIDLESLVFSPRNEYKLLDGTGVLSGIKKLQTRIENTPVTLIPYYAWENREPGKMLVWVNYAE